MYHSIIHNLVMTILSKQSKGCHCLPMHFIKFCHFITNLVCFYKLFTCILSCMRSVLAAAAVSPPRVSVCECGGRRRRGGRSSVGTRDTELLRTAADQQQPHRVHISSPQRAAAQPTVTPVTPVMC